MPIRDRHFYLPRMKTLISATAIATLLSTPAIAEETPTEAIPAPSKLQQFRDRASDLTVGAMGLIGIHYKRGGDTPETGLDCSGFVRYVFKGILGTDLPRTAKEISKAGDNVEKKDLKPGDLVFYNTMRKGFSHVGIYLGDNKFIHSPAAGGQVRIESMDVAYWKKRFDGAPRIKDTTQTPN
jgi:cell wall-associated NlpC family hydrolase